LLDVGATDNRASHSKRRLGSTVALPTKSRPARETDTSGEFNRAIVETLSHKNPRLTFCGCSRHGRGHARLWQPFGPWIGIVAVRRNKNTLRFVAIQTVTIRVKKVRIGFIFAVGRTCALVRLTSVIVRENNIICLARRVG